METKHTPGPWRTARHPNGGITIFGAARLPVLTTIGDNLPGLRWGGSRPDAEANAALIAAAPELLKALRAALLEIEDAKTSGWRGDPDIHTDIKAAIATATGQVARATR